MKSLLSLAALGLFAVPLMAQEPTVLPPPPPPAQSPVVSDAEVRAATKPIHVKKIILVGDSTIQVGSGWGPGFCSYHVTSFLTCVNLARGGRSSFSYRAEGSWNIALSEMKTSGYDAVYVLIQFGHNDQPGKPGRTTDLYTEFPVNIAGYVSEVRAAGAIPVLVTPITRRSFKNGSLQDDLEPWSAAVRKVASEMKVPLVDLHAVSVAAVQKLGAKASLDFAEMAAPPEVIVAAEKGTTIAPTRLDGPVTTTSSPAAAPAPALTATEVVETPQAKRNIVFDYTHLGDKGAAFFAELVTKELARAVPELRKDLIP